MVLDQASIPESNECTSGQEREIRDSGEIQPSDLRLETSQAARGVALWMRLRPDQYHECEFTCEAVKCEDDVLISLTERTFAAVFILIALNEAAVKL